MKRPSFLEGAVFALAASAGGGVLYWGLTTVLSGWIVARMLTALMAFAYVLYLLARSQTRTGRVTVIAAWSAVAAATWMWSPPLLVYLAVHLGLVWLVRALYFRGSVLTALADLGLVVLGSAVAAWAVLRTGSPWIGVWCFFLTQALFTAIPADLRRKRPASPVAGDAFDRAHRAAESALRRLSSAH